MPTDLCEISIFSSRIHAWRHLYDSSATNFIGLGVQYTDYHSHPKSVFLIPSLFSVWSRKRPIGCTNFGSAWFFTSSWRSEALHVLYKKQISGLSNSSPFCTKLSTQTIQIIPVSRDSIRSKLLKLQDFVTSSDVCYVPTCLKRCFYMIQHPFIFRRLNSYLIFPWSHFKLPPSQPNHLLLAHHNFNNTFYIFYSHPPFVNLWSSSIWLQLSRTSSLQYVTLFNLYEVAPMSDCSQWSCSKILLSCLFAPPVNSSTMKNAQTRNVDLVSCQTVSKDPWNHTDFGSMLIKTLLKTPSLRRAFQLYSMKCYWFTCSDSLKAQTAPAHMRL